MNTTTRQPDDARARELADWKRRNEGLANLARATGSLAIRAAWAREEMRRQFAETPPGDPDAPLPF